jgi:hypothetical protein
VADFNRVWASLALRSQWASYRTESFKLRAFMLDQRGKYTLMLSDPTSAAAVVVPKLSQLFATSASGVAPMTFCRALVVGELRS